MTRLTDPADIRAHLRTDPAWGAYALCDLSPAVLPRTQWFTPDLTLVLHDYGTCILFAMGTGSLRDALGHVTWPCHVQVRDDGFKVLARTLDMASPRTALGRYGYIGCRSCRGRIRKHFHVDTISSPCDSRCPCRSVAEGIAYGPNRDRVNSIINEFLVNSQDEFIVVNSPVSPNPVSKGVHRYLRVKLA